MTGLAARAALCLGAYAAALAGSSFFLSVARRQAFSWWWPLAVAAIALTLATVGGPCRAESHYRRSRTLVLSGAVLGLAGVAGWITLRPGFEVFAALAWLMMLVVVVWAGWDAPATDTGVALSEAGVQWPRWSIGSLSAIVLSGVAALTAASSEASRLPVGLWSIALVVVVWSAGKSSLFTEEHPVRGRPGPSVEIAVLAAIMACAVALRVIGLGDVPIRVDGDEGRIGIHIALTLQGLREPLFDLGWNGFAQVGFFVQGLWMRVLGPSLETLRLGSATAGAFGVLLLYVFLRELCGWRAAVIGAALLAANPEHLSWSRTGFMNVQAITLVTLAMAALAAALRRGRLVWWALLGCAVGGCLLTYHAAKAVVGVVAAVVVLEILVVRSRRRALAVGVMTAAIAALVTVLPWVPAAIERWDWYTHEIGKRFDVHRLVEAVEDGDTDGVRDYLSHHVGSVVAVPVASHQGGFVPSGGMLDPASAVVVVGAPLWLLYWWRRRSARIVLVWIAVLAVSSGMLTFDPPWKPRLVMALPAVVAAVAMVLDMSGRCGDRDRRRLSSALPWLLAGLCVVSGVTEAWSRHVDPYLQGWGISDPKSSLIRVLRDLRAEGWVGSDPVLLIGATNRDEANLYFSQRHGLLGSFDDVEDVGDDVAAIPVVDPEGRSHVVIVAPRQKAILSVIRAHYPEARLRRVVGALGETMYTVVGLDREMIANGRGWRRSDHTVQTPPFELAGGTDGRWSGRLFVPAAGRLGLELEGCDDGKFRIDGRLGDDDGRGSVVLAAAGWHDVEVEAHAAGAGCSLEPRWKVAWSGSWEPIPAWAMRSEPSGHGLVLRLWRTRQISTQRDDIGPDLWRIDPVLSYDFDMVERRETLPPVFHTGSWSAQWDGTIAIPGPAWTLELEFDTARAELEVGGREVRADGPGVVRVEGLDSGDHRLSVRATSMVEAPLQRLVVKLYWAAAGEEPDPVPYGALTPTPELMIRPLGE